MPHAAHHNNADENIIDLRGRSSAFDYYKLLIFIEIEYKYCLTFIVCFISMWGMRDFSRRSDLKCDVILKRRYHLEHSCRWPCEALDIDLSSRDNGWPVCGYDVTPTCSMASMIHHRPLQHISCNGWREWRNAMIWPRVDEVMSNCCRCRWEWWDINQFLNEKFTFQFRNVRFIMSMRTGNTKLDRVVSQRLLYFELP